MLIESCCVLRERPISFFNVGKSHRLGSNASCLCTFNDQVISKICLENVIGTNKSTLLSSSWIKGKKVSLLFFDLNDMIFIVDLNIWILELMIKSKVSNHLLIFFL